MLRSPIGRSACLVLGAFLYGACGDDESLEELSGEATGTSGSYPYLPQAHEPNCKGFIDRLHDCGVLAPGDFQCREPETPADHCAFQCFTIASCGILAQLGCTSTAAPPLEQCLSKCSDFDCGSGESVPTYWTCDGQPDCLDGSDEGNCFECGSGEVLPVAYECDFVNHCADGSDEIDCGGFTCGTGEVISESWRCDLEADCNDASDEIGCDYFECVATGESIFAHWHCDGEEDCLDGSDEKGCAKLICP